MLANSSKITGVRNGLKLVEEDIALSQNMIIYEKFLEEIGDNFLDT
jgi:hypothetical protein